MRRALLSALVLLTLAATAAAQTPEPAPPAGHEDHPVPAPAVQQSGEAKPAPTAVDLPPFIPPLTDADRAAAFPDVHGHAMRDNVVNYYVLFDQFEWASGGGPDAYTWDTKGWIGRDLDRFWFRTEGDGDEAALNEAHADLLYGRAISRWWEVVGGVRQDVRPGSPQTWGAVGVQGLAPYWFEVEATAYVGSNGRTEFRLETEYSFLLTNRLILQPLVELNVFGKDDPAREVGRGISSAHAGVRLRYEFRREFAPYIGVTWDRSFFGTADYARAADEPVSRTRLVLGVRFWM
jgi:copper resistance protein B